MIYEAIGETAKAAQGEKAMTEELEALKERYRKHGLLLQGKGCTWEKTLTSKKSVQLFAVTKATNGGWDVLSSSGTVSTKIVALTKVYMFSDDDPETLLSCWNLVIGPIFLQFTRIIK